MTKQRISLALYPRLKIGVAATHAHTQNISRLGALEGGDGQSTHGNGRNAGHAPLSGAGGDGRRCRSHGAGRTRGRPCHGADGARDGVRGHGRLDRRRLGRSRLGGGLRLRGRRRDRRRLGGHRGHRGRHDTVVAAWDRRGLGSGRDGDDGDDVARNNGLTGLAAALALAASVRAGNGPGGGGLGAQVGGLGEDLGGDLALGAGSFAGAVGDGVRLGGGEDGRDAGQRRSSRGRGQSGAAALAGAPGGRASDSLRGDGANGASSHVGRARSHGVRVGGRVGRSVSRRSRRVVPSRGRERLGAGRVRGLAGDGAVVAVSVRDRGVSRGLGRGRGNSSGRVRDARDGGLSGAGCGSDGTGRSSRGRGHGLAALALKRGDGIWSLTDGDELGAAVLVVGKVDVAVVPVVDDVGGAQEGIAKDREA